MFTDKLDKPFALVASDLHLQDKTWKHRDIVGDAYTSWRQIVEAAIEQQVKCVILAGDVLDRQTNLSKPVTELLRGVEKLGRHGITTVFVQGQHELQEEPWAAISAYAHHLAEDGPYELPDQGFVIVGVDYQHKEHLVDSLSYLAEAYAYEPEKMILVMHQVWRDWMGDRALPQGEFSDVDGFVPGLELLITGDLHESRLESYKTIKHILSPGSTCMQSIAEPEDKFMYWLQQAEDSSLEIVRDKLVTRQVFRYQITNQDEHAEFLKDVADYQKNIDPMEWKPLAHIRYSADVVSPGSIENCCNKMEVFLKELSPLNADDSGYLREKIEEGIVFTLESLLSEQEDISDDVRNLAERLLSSPEPENVLLSWYEERIKT